MSILFNQFTSLDEIAGHLPDVAPPFAGIDSDTAIIGDPHWRRGFFMALQAAQFYCPPDHPMIALAEWLLDVGWEPMWRDNGSGSPLGMAGGDCDEFTGDALEKAEAGAAVVWRFFAVQPKSPAFPGIF